MAPLFFTEANVYVRFVYGERPSEFSNEKAFSRASKPFSVVALRVWCFTSVQCFSVSGRMLFPEHSNVDLLIATINLN